MFPVHLMENTVKIQLMKIIRFIPLSVLNYSPLPIAEKSESRKRVVQQERNKLFAKNETTPFSTSHRSTRG